MPGAILEYGRVQFLHPRARLETRENAKLQTANFRNEDSLNCRPRGVSAHSDPTTAVTVGPGSHRARQRERGGTVLLPQQLIALATRKKQE